jgi:TPR repeat protein
MLLVPSPASLVHGGTLRQFQTPFLTPAVQAPSSPSDDISVDLLLALASSAATLGLAEASFSLYQAAAARGSISAMNQTAFICRSFRHLVRVPRGFFYRAAVNWNTVALRLKSVDAVRHRAEFLCEKGNNQESLVFFAVHFRATQSILSASVIGRKMFPFGLKYLKFCIAKGHQSVVSPLIRRFEKMKDINEVVFWKEFAKEAPRRRQSPSPIFHRDTSTVSFRPLADFVLKMEEPFSKPKFDLQKKESVRQFRPETQRTGQHKTEREPVPAVRYIPRDCTSYLLLAFEYAAPDVENRNLHLCQIFLNRLYDNDLRGILASRLWMDKCTCGNAKDIVRCGFIASLVGDPNYATTLFSRAARLGNRTGSVMAGLGWAHLTDIRRPREACFYFAQCVTDPIALIHLGLFTGEPHPMKKAAAILGVREDSAAMFTLIGDLFSQGVKFPFNRKIALVFYGLALSKAEVCGEDITDIIRKMNQF